MEHLITDYRNRVIARSGHEITSKHVRY